MVEIQERIKGRKKKLSEKNPPLPSSESWGQDIHESVKKQFAQV